MKTLKKLLLLLLLCNVIFFSCIDVYAYNYPTSFWSTNEKYETALNANDFNGIIQYRNKIISLMQTATDGPEKRNILVTRYNQVGMSYAALGDYDNTTKVYKTLNEYASQYGDEFYDYVKASKARSQQYESEIIIYTDGGKTPYYGAINEKKNGVLFGMCANGGTRSKLDNESMVLTYQELGQKLLSYNIGVVRNATSAGIAVEFALNCPKEGTDIKNIRNMDSYLLEICRRI